MVQTKISDKLFKHIFADDMFKYHTFIWAIDRSLPQKNATWIILYNAMLFEITELSIYNHWQTKY